MTSTCSKHHDDNVSIGRHHTSIYAFTRAVSWKYFSVTGRRIIIANYTAQRYWYRSDYRHAHWLTKRHISNVKASPCSFILPAEYLRYRNEHTLRTAPSLDVSAATAAAAVAVAAAGENLQSPSTASVASTTTTTTTTTANMLQRTRRSCGSTRRTTSGRRRTMSTGSGGGPAKIRTQAGAMHVLTINRLPGA